MSDPRRSDSLDALRAAIAADGGELATLVAPPSAGEAFGPLADAGPRAQERGAGYTLALESIFEGYLLHYARPRVLRTPDADLALLAGDYLYAFGLARLARLEDLEAVAELADLISLCARAQAADAAGGPDPTRGLDPAGGPDPAASLPAGLWALAALAVGTGAWEAHGSVKSAARRGDPDAGERALAEAAARAESVDLADELSRALIAFSKAVARPPGTM